MHIQQRLQPLFTVKNHQIRLHSAPKHANQDRQGGEQWVHGRRAYSRMLQRRVRQPSQSRNPRWHATNTSARMNRRTCARCSLPCPPRQRVGSWVQDSRKPVNQVTQRLTNYQPSIPLRHLHKMRVPLLQKRIEPFLRIGGDGGVGHDAGGKGVGIVLRHVDLLVERALAHGFGQGTAA